MKPNIRILVVYGCLVVMMVMVMVFESHKERFFEDNTSPRPGAFRAPKIWSELVLEDDNEAINIVDVVEEASGMNVASQTTPNKPFYNHEGREAITKDLKQIVGEGQIIEDNAVKIKLLYANVNSAENMINSLDNDIISNDIPEDIYTENQVKTNFLNEFVAGESKDKATKKPGDKNNKFENDVKVNNEISFLHLLKDINYKAGYGKSLDNKMDKIDDSQKFGGKNKKDKFNNELSSKKIGEKINKYGFSEDDAKVGYKEKLAKKNTRVAYKEKVIADATAERINEPNGKLNGKAKDKVNGAPKDKLIDETNDKQTNNGDKLNTGDITGQLLLGDPYMPEFVENMPKEFNIMEEGLDMIDPPLKKILVWVEGYGSKTMSFGFGRAPFVRAGCEVDTCMMTENRTLVPFKEFDALIFHFRAMTPKTLPKQRHPHQSWVFWEMESASYIYQNPARYNGMFNLTMTYRRDSDVYSAYGHIYPLPPSTTPTESAPRAETNYAAGKTKMAAWFVSNCYTHSRREKLVAVLQKFMKVDIIGKCGSMTCPRSSSTDCYTTMAKHYKFYFSFENSLCKDYVTEKLFSVLRYDVVPVVFGLADYNNMAPPHSFINVLDFSNVEHLAKYLHYLNNNDTAYNQYFKWKTDYRVDNGWSNTARGFCDLCKILHHQGEGYHQTYQDLRGWFVGQGGCKRLDTSQWMNWLW